MKNKVIIEGNVRFEDLELREWVNKLQTKMETLNERYKRQTIQIKELEELKKEIKK